MLSEVTTAIQNALSVAFGNEYSVYTKEMEQGYLKPCFFIGLADSSQKRVVGKRYLNNYSFEIKLIPSESGDNLEIYKVAEKMNEVLKVITVGQDPLSGRDLHYKTLEGNLYFYASYNFYITEVFDESDVLMGGVIVSSTAKG